VGVRWENDAWVIQGKPLNPRTRYSVALSDFRSREARSTSVPHPHEPAGPRRQGVRDIRRAVIDELAATYPVKK